jgi:hypothetical protein
MRHPLKCVCGKTAGPFMYFKVKKVKKSRHLIEIIPNVCLTNRQKPLSPLLQIASSWALEIAL